MSQYPPGYRPARRPVSKQVYRRRRAVVLGGLLLIIVLIIVGISRCSSGDATPTIPSVTPSAPAPAPTESLIPTVAPTAPAAGATPGATPAPSGAIAGVDVGYAGPEEVCAPRSVQVTAVTDKTAYAAAEQPQLSMALQNVGATACKLNVGTNAQLFQISTNGKLFWQSTDCQTGATDYWALIQPGQKLSSSTPIAWSREKSSPDTCDATRPKAPAGTYYLTTYMGSSKSAQALPFTLK
jgi:hypothetical protein